MSYILDITNEFLDDMRTKYPMTQLVIDRVQRSSLLRLGQWVKAHYEIDPFRCTECGLMDGSFIDPLHIAELAMGSVQSGELDLWGYKGFADGVKKEDYAVWAGKKGFALPMYFQNIQSWELPVFNSLESVYRVSWNKLPAQILAALGANAIAQAKKRAASNVSISDAIRCNPMKLFVEDCGKGEKKPKRADDTIREYIERQFS